MEINDKIDNIVSKQREFFKSGATKVIQFRIEMLKQLLKLIDENQEAILKALFDDLHKSQQEAYLTEISIVRGEIKKHLKNIKKWSAVQRVSTPIKLYPSKSYIVPEPLGNALIIAPWNYPFQLLLNPLVGAISAGCTALLKPSPYSSKTSTLMAELIPLYFEESYIAVVEGNRDVNTLLLSHKWDIIFFTGSPALGKVVMKAAAENLTPVVLELGGKSPCIVDSGANLKVAAKRIAWGKMINSGQTCIAPDYLLVNEEVKDQFIDEFNRAVKSLQGDIKSSKHYCRMINVKAFDRAISYINDAEIILAGGSYDREELFIEPTIITCKSDSCPALEEEIFAPVFPLLSFSNSQDLLEKISSIEKPLAFYYFGDERVGMSIISKSTSGGACINDTIMHIANENLPFGGVGNSGMGRYHGYKSFEAFTNMRSLLVTHKKFDTPFRYMPYRLFSIIKRIV